jgi:hypothetical protein
MEIIMRKFSAETVHPTEVNFFIGFEAVGKPTQGMKILGVRGHQLHEDIVKKALENQVQGILLGANKSFWPSSAIATNEEWDAMIMNLLTKTRYKVILSMSANDIGLFDLSKYYVYGRFYLQLFVTAPGLEKCPPDTTIVIEDRMWEQNNRCLYSFDLGTVLQGENAVPWDDIATDVVVEKDNN